jgi:hypothetical protein
MAGMSGRTAFRFGVAAALAASLLQLWIALAVGIVGEPDNPQNQGFYGVVAAAAACAFTARFEAAGLARAMLATAGVQALLGVAVATAPATAQDPNGPGGVVLLSAGLIALWLLAAWAFQRGASAGAAMAAPA